MEASSPSELSNLTPEQTAETSVTAYFSDQLDSTRKSMDDPHMVVHGGDFDIARCRAYIDQVKAGNYFEPFTIKATYDGMPTEIENPSPYEFFKGIVDSTDAKIELYKNNPELLEMVKKQGEEAKIIAENILKIRLNKDGLIQPKSDILGELVMRRQAMKNREYTTTRPDGSNGGLTFEQIEDVTPEARKYHGFVGEVKATVDGLLEDEIRRRDSSQGEGQKIHEERVNRLATMKTVMDMELGLVYADIGPFDDEKKYAMLCSIQDTQARSSLLQRERDHRMRQCDLPTTRQKLDELRVKREQDIQIHPEDNNAARYLEATNNLIAFIDRITPNTQPNSHTTMH